MQESFSHIKTEKFWSNIINGSWNFGYMSLNSSWKINSNGSTLVGWTNITIYKTDQKTLNWKAHNLIQTSLES
jgi:hypothetical protein